MHVIDIWNNYEDSILMPMFIAPIMHCRTAITNQSIPFSIAYFLYFYLGCIAVHIKNWFAASVWNILQGRKAEKTHSLNMWRKRPGPCCRPAQLQGVAEIHKHCPLALYQPVITLWEHITRPWNICILPIAQLAKSFHHSKYNTGKCCVSLWVQRPFYISIHHDK